MLNVIRAALVLGCTLLAACSAVPQEPLELQAGLPAHAPQVQEEPRPPAAVLAPARQTAQPAPSISLAEYGPDTIVVSTPERRLYYTDAAGATRAYNIGVGRPGFTWGKTLQISAKKEWPDWYPPDDMRERQPWLPKRMVGGPGNPLGAAALYLGSTLYRIHGTNNIRSIGQAESSGCFRMMNRDIADLYERVQVGTKVVVLQ